MNRRLPILILVFLLLALAVFPSVAGAQVIGANLLSNADFAQVDAAGMPSDWTSSSYLDEASSTTYTVSQEGYGGGNCLQVESPKRDDARWQQVITVLPNSIYHISGYIWAKDAGTQGSGANISALEAMEAPVFVGDTDGEWKYYEYYGTTGADQTQLTLCLRLGGYGKDATGIARFDDVSVQQALEIPAGAASANLYRQESSGNTTSEPTQAETIKETKTYADSLLFSMFYLLMLYFIVHRVLRRKDGPLQPSQGLRYDLVIAGAFVVGMLVRLYFSATVDGFATDMQCFKGWSDYLANNGSWSFYTSGMFADYPPGYMYILWPIGLIRNIFGLSYDSGVYDLLIKLPGVLADGLLAYWVFKKAKSRFGPRASVALALLVLFNPVSIFNSSMFGQIDSILVLFLVLSMDKLIQGKRLPACLLYVVALLIKPQALMLGPVYLFALIADVLQEGKPALKAWLTGIGAGIGLFVVAILPFWGSQSAFWIFGKYFGTMVSYAYNTINACNLFMLGGNWVPDTATALVVSYRTLGLIFVGLVIAASAFLYFKNPNRKNLPLVGAFLIAGCFVLGPYMHERYIFPAIFLLFLAYLWLRDRRLLWLAGGFSCTLLFNAAMVLSLGNLNGGSWAVIAVSIVNVILFGLLCWTCWDILLQKRLWPYTKDVPKERLPAPMSVDTLKQPCGRKLNFRRKDAILLCALTVVYGAVALINLGSTAVPQQGYRAQTQQDITVQFAQPSAVNSIMYYGSVADGMATVELTDAAGNVVAAQSLDQQYGQMYQWMTLSIQGQATGATIRVTQPDVWLLEVVFLDADAGVISTTSASTNGEVTADNDPANLLDETALLVQPSSYMYEMYFDEIYHARTAFEFQNGMAVYETTHPPLGKIFIMLGVEVFGMNPFGWRIVGTLFGIGMIPLMYLFGMRLFKRTRYAFIAAFLFAFDFMHFVQTRIATIDVYGVFFIILMLYFMYRYISTSFYNQPLKKTLLPLGLCGLAFGLGAASKWICLYTGVGLAVLLFWSLYRRYREYQYAKARLEQGDADADTEYLQHVVAVWKPYTLRTLLWCVLFFLVIPAGIYILSYLPWLLATETNYTFSSILKNQQYMFSYHSELTATHPYSAQWWDWPLIFRPIWYYAGKGLPSGTISAISAFGNPAVWWAGFAATIWMIMAYVRGTLQKSKGIFLALVALCFSFLPWVLVDRATFIYHYFASVPFIIFAIVYFIRWRETSLEARIAANLEAQLCGKRLKRFKRGVVVYLVIVLVLFAAFYPVLSGTPISLGWAELLRWSDRWIFYI